MNDQIKSELSLLKAKLKKGLTRENAKNYIKTRSAMYWMNFMMSIITIGVVWQSGQAVINTTKFLAQNNYTVPLVLTTNAKNGLLSIGLITLAVIPMFMLLFIYICYETFVMTPLRTVQLQQQVAELRSRLEAVEKHDGVQVPPEPKNSASRRKTTWALSISVLIMVCICLVIAIVFL